MTTSEFDQFIPVPAATALNESHLIYLLVGFFMVAFGFIAIIIRDRLYLSEALTVTLFGILIGPVGLNYFNPFELFGNVDEIVLEVSRVIIAFQCLTVGATLPVNYLSSNIPAMAMILGPVMLAMWAISSVGVSLIFGFSPILSATIGACVTPTDPVLAAAIVKGKFADKHIPEKLGLLIGAESAANDGLGLAFLFLVLYVQVIQPLPKALGLFAINIAFYQIILAAVTGMAIGYVSLMLLKMGRKNDWIEKESLLLIPFSLMLFVVGSHALLGVDDVLAAFFAGVGLSWDGWYNEQIKGAHVSEILDSIFNIVYFFMIGALMPWDLMARVGYTKLFTLSVFILLFRRLPAVLVFWKFIPGIDSWRDAFLAGWFGPIGAGAIFYSMVLIEFDVPNTREIVAVVFFIVLSSVLVHGGSVSIINAVFNAYPREEKSSGYADMVQEYASEGSYMENGKAGKFESVEKPRSSYMH